MDIGIKFCQSEYKYSQLGRKNPFLNYSFTKFIVLFIHPHFFLSFFLSLFIYLFIIYIFIYLLIYLFIYLCFVNSISCEEAIKSVYLY